MKQKIFVIIFLATGLISCKSKKAIELRNVIVKQERVAFNILVGKGGAEEEKLNCLIKKDFKGALVATDKIEQEFNNIIKTIEALPTEGVKQGDELKKAAVDYYTGLRDMKNREREEIRQQEAGYDKDPEKASIAANKLVELNKEQLVMSGKVREKDEKLYHTLQQFEEANNLR
ncbi:hypothetical protein [Chitinophaga sp.]|uniref:hypothetical protein n=1 Tax=Chitinophaga sp. TaxID=1869181 RepID=UPI002B7A8A75|nr:hypothetical protein [Chitinophaga sp.]HWV67715.1 hypothetical protein [Chitinophaga sp.]